MFVLLGSNGQITSQLARLLLLAGGHAVRVVGRSAGALAPLQAAGAQVAAGDPTDAAFLQRAFAGATAVYTMTPPCYAEPDMRAAQDRIGTAVAQALRAAGVRRVVNLSSVGAELPSGTGPIAGLHAQERRLDAIDGLDLLHLRPGSFMENLLPLTGAVAAMDALPGMESPEARIPMVATADIAAVAARELVTPQHRGVLVLHAPGSVTLREAAALLGSAIGKPGLQYVQTSGADTKAMLREQGFSADAADQLEALAAWLSTSPLGSLAVAPAEVQPTTLDAFARGRFAAAYAEVAGQPA
ncbi:NAD(P)H-binding protein [Ramlibacter pallidus]|uniref:NAD(P)H-binding protein n=1 Tax=Ramlibacter pallidus TaxID=2780087 RepID=A0ABR9S684_9BURK|nr:NAD(P)H-binding protein [Ramlibacter pallidus]MBE7368971.1 NAD(P)H-binding protein [Ramlibacter pallidus]